MRKFTLCLLSIIWSIIVIGQGLPEEYMVFAKKADSLFAAKKYKEAAFSYSAAFKANGWKGTGGDRYNAACCWAMANCPDSAFFQLNRIATRLKYKEYDYITNDNNLSSLHKDKRWEQLIKIVKQNKDELEVNYNRTLISRLDSIYIDDQNDRLLEQQLVSKYGFDSKEVKSIWKTITIKDSINQIKVTAILDKYGWLGTDVIGEKGNSALFLVIQHSNLKTWEKYLPMMREAVINGKASGSELALLEDRTALAEGKKQTYGSQIGIDKEGHYFVLPLEDPDNVDKRRASVGLTSMEFYLSNWELKWDVEQYKKDLPKIEANIKSK